MSARRGSAAVLVCLISGLGLAARGEEADPRPPAFANETTWSAWLARQVGGKAEHRLPNGARVDILTDEVAWEVEWADKWPESIGQSLYYGIASDRAPGVWLLMKSGGVHDESYLECLTVITRLRDRGIPIRFRVEMVDRRE